MFDIFGKWKVRITRYLEVRLRLMQLGVISFTSRVLGYFIFSMLLLLLFFLFLLVAGLGVAEACSEWLQSRTAGYYMAAGIYLLLVALVLLLRKSILRGLAGIFIRTLTNEKDDDFGIGPEETEPDDDKNDS